MALTDAFGSGDDTTLEPTSIVQGLLAQRAPDLAQNGSVDPQMVENRLIRGMLSRDQQRALQKQKDDDAANPDLSSFGKTPDELGPNAAPNGEAPDFASFGTPDGEQVGSGKVPVADSSNAATVFGQSAVAGAVKGLIGKPLQGASEVFEPTGEAPPEVDPAAMAGTPGGETSVTNAMQPPKSVQDSLGYQAGKAVNEFADKHLGPDQASQEAHPIAAGVGAGVGNILPIVGAAMVNPALGLAAAAGSMGLSGAADAYESAKKNGASDDQAQRAAEISAAADAAIGSLPIGNVIAPYTSALGKTLATRALAQAGENGLVFTTAGEAQHYVDEQITPKIYAAQTIAKLNDDKANLQAQVAKVQADPQLAAANGQWLTQAQGSLKQIDGQIAQAGSYLPDFDPTRITTEFLTGALVGGGHSLLHDLTARETPQPNDKVIPDDVTPEKQTGLPPPRKTKTDTDEDEPETGEKGPGPGPTPRPGDGTGEPETPKEKPEPFETTLNQNVRDNLEAKAAYYKEFHPDDIASWSDDKLKDYVNTKFGGGSQAPDETAPAGTVDNPIDLKSTADVRRAEAMASTTHTPAQGEANNVQHGHATWNGLGVTIEVPAGGVRRGVNKETGLDWQSSYPDAYGYFKGLPPAADGMEPDVIIGNHPNAPTVFLVDELDKRGDKAGQYKQTKAFVGFQTPQDALKSYLGISTKTPDQLGGMRAMGRDEFVEFAKAGGMSKPVSDAMSKRSETPSENPSKKPPQNPAENVANNPAEKQNEHLEPVEPTPDDHRAVEQAVRNVGVDPKNVREADMARAAEIHRQEGYSPEDFYQLAMVRNAIDDGVLKPDQVKELYGDKIASLLATAGPSGSGGVRAETPSAATGGPAAPAGTAAGERIPGGGANGKESLEPTGGEKPAGNEGANGSAAGDSANGINAEPEHGNAEGNDRGIGGKAAAATQHENAEHAGNALIGAEVPSIPEHKVSTADGTSVQVKPVVVEASKLITSSDDGYDKSLQPRQRERAASQAQIRGISAGLNPERLGYSAEADRGAPIVGPDRMVESGNGRVAAIRNVYASNPTMAKRYRDWLKEQGVDVAKYKEPILVRQRVSELDQEGRKAFTVGANQASTLSMSAPERALADADHISPAMLDGLKDGDLNHLENRGFVRSFMGALPPTERGSLVSGEGHLSAEGLARVKNAVLAKAYGDPDIISRITESTDDDVKSISNALVAAAPAWAKLKSDIDAGTVPKEFDLTPELVDAVKRTADLRSKGMKLDEYLAQQDAFDHIQENVDGFIRNFYDPTTKRARSAQRIAEYLQAYAVESGKVRNEAGLGLDMPKVTPNDVQATAARKTQSSGDRVRQGVAEKRPSDRGRGSRKSSAGSLAAKLRGARKPTTKLSEPDRRYGGGELFAAETGADGRPQLVIPGTERVDNAELAKRRAAEPLKAKVAQKPLEGGLFGDQSKQLDLEQAIAGKEPAVEGDQEKTSAQPAEKRGELANPDLPIKENGTLESADTGEAHPIKVTGKGPWDFNDTWPLPNQQKLKAFEKERGPVFDEQNEDGSYDPEQIAGVLDETLNGMVGDYSVMRRAGRLRADLRAGKIKPPKRQSVEQYDKLLSRDIAQAADSFNGTAGAIADLWDNDAVSAMKHEARQRVLQEEKSTQFLPEAVENDLSNLRGNPER